MSESKVLTRERKRRSFSRKDVYDILSILFIGASVLLGMLRFFPVLTRFLQALRDLGLSVAFYFTELCAAEGAIVPTVVQIPDNIQATLPIDLDTFLLKLNEYGALLVDRENFTSYFSGLLRDTADALMIIVMFLPIVIAVIYLFSRIYTAPNNDYSRKTKPRIVFEKLENTVWFPVKRFIKGYSAYLKEHTYTRGVLCLIWLYNLNVLTILAEAFAYLFYFAIEFFDVYGLYAQLVKLVCDLGVAVVFLPWWAWAYIGIRVFDYIRKKTGDALLELGESCNRAFLSTYTCALFVTGKQRAKKTSILTDMKLTIERMFRDKAKEKFAERDMQFPNFNWIYLEQIVKAGQKKKLNTLYKCRKMIRELKYFFNNRGKYDERQTRRILKHLKEKWGYRHEDFLFGYEYERYGLEYNNGLATVDIFEALEKYAQLYKIYQQPTPLDVSNYSIREDLIWIDEGNFPIYDGDFFHRDPKAVKQVSQYSHIIPYNAFRLGRLTDSDDPLKDSVEYGIGVASEFAKERGNKDTKRGLKPTAEEANQENDLFETDVKMRGHAATIDNYTFFRWLFDDQREGSLGANNKDLTNICYVKEVSDALIVLPCTMFEQDLYALSTGLFQKIYYKLRHLRGDANNTLLVYVLKKLYAPIYNHYWRIFNRYSVYMAKLRVTDGMDGEVLEKSYKYYLATAKTYSNRFATDSYNEFYSAKAARSEFGLNNIPMYKGVRPTYDELCEQESYFVADISEAFGVEKKERLPSEESREGSKRGRNPGRKAA